MIFKENELEPTILIRNVLDHEMWSHTYNLLQLPDQLLRNKEIEKMMLTFKEFIIWSGEGIEREWK